MLDTFISWKPKELEVGIYQIDKEHKQIIDLINDSYRVLCKNYIDMLNRRYKDVVPIFESFTEVFSKHFHTEEKIMKENSYSDFIGHKAEHERLLFTIENYKGMISRRTNNQPLINNFIEFINTWTYLHITEDDQLFKDYMNTKEFIEAETN
jgi:hemerythrin